MVNLGDDLVLGYGQYPASVDGATIARLTPGSEIITETTLSEQGVHDIHSSAGKIYVAGTDPTGDWTLGNLYIRDDGGAWAQRRTLPLTIHTLGLCHDESGDLWAGVGAHAGDNTTWQGRVMRSVDDGLNWIDNTQLNNYRIFDVAALGSDLYAVGDGIYNKALYRYHLGVWSTVAGVQAMGYQRLTEHNGNLYTFAVNTPETLIEISSSGVVTQRNIGFNASSSLFNQIASDGDKIYSVSNAGIIWVSDDAIIWEQLARAPGAVSIGWWQSQNALVLSTSGSGAALYKYSL